jgi:hypothetical protein
MTAYRIAAELTTQGAAEFLNVSHSCLISRRSLITRLERRTHRGVALADLLEYRSL